MAKRIESLELVEDRIRRWRSKLKRAVNQLDKLEKQRKRLQHKPLPEAKPKD